MQRVVTTAAGQQVGAGATMDDFAKLDRTDRRVAQQAVVLRQPGGQTCLMLAHIRGVTAGGDHANNFGDITLWPPKQAAAVTGINLKPLSKPSIAAPGFEHIGAVLSHSRAGKTAIQAGIAGFVVNPRSAVIVELKLPGPRANRRVKPQNRDVVGAFPGIQKTVAILIDRQIVDVLCLKTAEGLGRAVAGRCYCDRGGEAATLGRPDDMAGGEHVIAANHRAGAGRLRPVGISDLNVNHRRMRVAGVMDNLAHGDRLPTRRAARATPGTPRRVVPAPAGALWVRRFGSGRILTTRP